jgi:hypothetical protein
MWVKSEFNELVHARLREIETIDGTARVVSISSFSIWHGTNAHVSDTLEV